MSFGALLADLDATAFAELSDDPLCVWTRQGSFSVMLPAMLTTAERAAFHSGISTIDNAPVVRLSVADVARLRPLDDPTAGDTLTIGGRLMTVHGQPWKDDQKNSRDWLCPVNR